MTVVDRQSGPALETSFANAGEVSPGYSAPWAGPGVPLKAVKWMLMHHRPLVIWPMRDMAMWRWGAMMLRNCTEARYRVNKSRMVRVAEYSRDCLKELRADTGIAYDERMQGTLQLFRTQKQFDGSADDIAVLRESGVAFELLDRNGCVRHEPALAHVSDKFVGGLLLPGDETGDCFKFTQALALLAAERGVAFRFGTSIRGIVEGQGGNFASSHTGKVKMIVQCVAVPTVLLAIALFDVTPGAPARWLIDITVWVAIAVTALSGWPYVLRGISALRAAGSGM